MKKIMGWVCTVLVVFGCWMFFVLMMGFIGVSIWPDDVPVLYAFAFILAPIMLSLYCGVRFKKGYNKKHEKTASIISPEDSPSVSPPIPEVDAKMEVESECDVEEDYSGTLSSAEMERINHLVSQTQNAARIVSDTLKPDTFFRNLNFLMDCLLDLRQYEKFEIFRGTTPSQYCERILAELETMVDDYISRAYENNRTEREKIKDKERAYKFYESFLISLISAFDCAHTFWTGNGVSPHYDGPLFTENNYERVQKLYDDLDEIYDILFIQPKVSRKIAEKESKLSYVEKERIMVQRVSKEDMLKFSGIPYDFDGPICKSFSENGHPFAYMVLNDINRKIAINHLEHLNRIIDSCRELIPMLGKSFYVDVGKIAFSEYSPSYGYTRLICEPYTFSGSVSEFPVCLKFMTRDDRSYMANGSIYYSPSGEVGKAEAHIFRGKSSYSGGEGWSFYFRMIDEEITLMEAKTTLVPDEKGLPSAVYKDKSVIEYEKEKACDMKSFEWMQKNIPEKCPKSFPGYRQMKTQNSKNYQALKKYAAEHGKEI